MLCIPNTDPSVPFTAATSTSSISNEPPLSSTILVLISVMTLTPDASNNSSPAPNSNTFLKVTLPSATVLIHASSVVSKAPPSYLITYTKLNNSASDIVLSSTCALTILPGKLPS